MVIKQNIQHDSTGSLVDVELATTDNVSRRQQLSVRTSQSKRLSESVVTKTELYKLKKKNSVENISPESSTRQREGSKKHENNKCTSSSGVTYWLHEIHTAYEHGGNYQCRVDDATRAALGSLLVFSILVFTHQQILGAVWIGNIFFHTNVQNNLGSAIISANGFAKSILLTTAVSWPVAFFFKALSTTEAAICLPFVAFVLSFIIMSCPHLTSRNLMILVMYILIASNVRDDDEWWVPLGWTATYLLGLVIAVIMNILPRPRMALHYIHEDLSRLEKDMAMLLLECKEYADTTAECQPRSRAAVATIEMLQRRISSNIKSINDRLPAAKIELALRCNDEAAKNLSDWAKQAQKLEIPIKTLTTVLSQRVLGEEYAMMSPLLREAKQRIMNEIGITRDRMLDAMIAGLTVCRHWSDPTSHCTVLPDILADLEDSTADCREAFNCAIKKAVVGLDESPEKNMPVFAHLTRRMSAFNALFELGDCLTSYLSQHGWDDDENIDKVSLIGPCEFLVWCLNECIGFFGKPWLWHNPENFRLALKTAVGMFLASLFVSVRFLWNVSSPFGVWPGLTIASVNLADTGSSFHKAADRLFGTLLAAAYSLLVSDISPENLDAVKIPALVLFSFAAIYLRNADHAYKYTYAATSVGSMLYGSVKNNFNIAGYIPKRIELIFVGIVLFSFVEILLFPRSSRKLVEDKCFQFFLDMRGFLKQAAICAQRMEDFVQQSRTNPSYALSPLFDDTIDAFQFDKLSVSLDSLKKGSSNLKKELESGLVEPNIGLSLPLQTEAFRGLTKDIAGCEVYASLLLNSMKDEGGYCKHVGSPIREMKWMQHQTNFLKDALSQTEECIEWLRSAFPDGRLRAQCGNSLKAVIAAAAFRGFTDVRLRTISGWSETYTSLVHEEGFDSSDPVAMMLLNITTSYILEICHHLQNAGKQVEKITYSFPSIN